jgi:hypothetical protein
MANVIKCTALPTGGIVTIDVFSEDIGSVWTLTRTPGVQESDTLVLFSGVPQLLASPNGLIINNPFWLDLGDGLNGPLDQSTAYTYEFTTESGSVSQTITPANTMVLRYDDFLLILVRVLQAGMDALALPGGIVGKKPSVIISMPLTGQPPLPTISINEDLLQQSIVPLGHGINTDVVKNSYEISEIVTRRYRITILCSSTQERTFFEMAVIALFKAILIPLLNRMGQDVTSSFQAASSQQIADPAPGFYFCDMMLEFQGDMPLQITTSYPVNTDFIIEANGEALGGGSLDDPLAMVLSAPGRDVLGVNPLGT